MALKPYAQTIPFEALMMEDMITVGGVNLIANPVNIKNDGISYSTLTVTVTDFGGSPIKGAQVNFTTTSGTLDQTSATTDKNGQANVRLYSSPMWGNANVTATCQCQSGMTNVNFTPATRVTVSPNPTQIVAGAQSTITIQLVDDTGSNVTQPGIDVAISISSWTGNPSKQPTLSSLLVTTDSNGEATLTMTGQTGAGAGGTATILASASGLSPGQNMVTILAPVAQVDLSANPVNIRNNGFDTSIITATVRDSLGAPLPNLRVDFTATAGTPSSLSAQTDSQGRAIFTLTSSTAKVTATVTATCQGIQNTTKVNFTLAVKIRITASPNPLQRGKDSTLTIQLLDDMNNNVTQQGIDINVRLVGWTGDAGKIPTLSASLITTDPNGRGTVTLAAKTGSGATGIATIEASASGLTSGQVTVTIN